MKNSILIIFAFYIFSVVGMEQKNDILVNFSNQNEKRSIFQDKPFFHEYENIFKRKVYGYQIEKFRDFQSLENLVSDAQAGKFKETEDYGVRISPKEPLQLLPYTSPYSIKGLSRNESLYPHFKIKLSSFSFAVINSLPYILKKSENEWIDLYISVLHSEYENWKTKKVWPLEKK